ncbi:protein FAR1-RELATED SEQUENCE 5-like [Tripterygium wilfordii]|uniref:protein FAR1-RELATED SEQUENCE 5-like n=1 Tax=Tripterygium wilfordii TaxID=458696 RepID=UPI0018F80079|nr:protein FAR1-RELATED SEQUENCE 5-like [Tripterygium wilfordii]
MVKLALFSGIFRKRLFENPSFNYAVQLDNEEQITNIFWADSRMLIDYIYFGDVIIFDTTYGTNKALRPLAVFTGFNHHRGIIVFGAALLYDETIASFKWLFKTFLAAHKEKMPQTIFTDQDAAMAKAINEVMPNTFHGLCSWYIMQNAIKHLAYLQKGDSTILEEFAKCMFHYENSFEFEEAWDAMNDKYNTHENSWLQGIYCLKKKWATCYLKYIFTLGSRSTQASESMNSDVKDNLQYDVSIAKFFGHFERVVQDKRHNELKADFDSREKSPTLAYKNSPMLQQASKVYTPNMFKRFQKQLDCATAATIVYSDNSKEVEEYKISLLKSNGQWVVLFNPKDKTISCSCGLFESLGILCCHALKVYDRFDVKYIPEAYIMKRWTRMAKSGYTEDEGQIIVEDVNLQVTKRYRSLCPRMVRLASRASEDKEIFAMVLATMEELEKKVDNQLTMKQDIIRESSQNEQPSQLVMGNIKGIKKRVVGRKGGKQPLSFLERQLNGKGKRTSRNISKDDASCSQTPTNNMEMQGQLSMPISTFESPLVHRPATSFLELLSGQIFIGAIQSSQAPYDFMDL